jgi:hypothetical protein
MKESLELRLDDIIKWIRHGRGKGKNTSTDQSIQDEKISPDFASLN